MKNDDNLVFVTKKDLYFENVKNWKFIPEDVRNRLDIAEMRAALNGYDDPGIFMKKNQYDNIKRDIEQHANGNN